MEAAMPGRRPEATPPRRRPEPLNEAVEGTSLLANPCQPPRVPAARPARRPPFPAAPPAALVDEAPAVPGAVERRPVLREPGGTAWLIIRVPTFELRPGGSEEAEVGSGPADQFRGGGT